MGDEVPVTVRLEGTAVPSTTLTVSATAHVLVLATTIASSQAPFSLHSAYVGQRGEVTAATHLLLAPGSSEASLTQQRHAPHELPVAEDERHLCLYDHLQRFLAVLADAGLDPQIDIADQSIALLDR